MAADPLVAVRTSVAVTPLDHVHLLRLSGPDASAALTRLCAGAIRARDGQLQHVLLLAPDGTPFADAFVLCDDEAYELIYEGPSPAQLLAHAARELPAGLDVTLEDRDATHAVIGIDGPFAWELVSRIAGTESVGLPYLTFFRTGNICCYRAGKTGEFGYGLIAPRAEREALVARLLEVGASLDVVPGTREMLEVAALENFFFNVHREGRAGLSPLELQLQWRVDPDGVGVGVEAVRARRAAGVRARVATLLAPSAVQEGEVVQLGGRPIGRVLSAARSPSCDGWVALALLDIELSVPGLTGLQVGATAVPARSVSPPVLNNVSLFVSPQMHAYATRDEILRPPLVRA